MTSRITITCPACSATLAAPASAVGKILLCPKCRTGISVPPPAEAALAAIAEKAAVDAHQRQERLRRDAAANRQQMWNTVNRLLRRLAVGLSVLMMLGLIVWGTQQFQVWRKVKTIEAALQERHFDLVLSLEPNHVDALIGRARQQLELPQTSVDGAVRDLEQLQRLVPEHPIHTAILPALSIARSVEHAEAGRIAAAIQELQTSTKLKAEEPQLAQVKQILITALLKQAEINLQNGHHDQALADCEEILKLGGTIAQVTPFERVAFTALTERAITGPEIDNTIQRLEALIGTQHSVVVTEQLGILHLRQSKLAHSEGAPDEAVDHFRKLRAYGLRDVEVLQFGVTLADAMTAAFEKDRSKLNRKRALLIAELLEKDFAKSEDNIFTRIRLAKALFSDTTSEDRDGDLDFAARNVDQARARGINIEQHSEFLKALARALIKRGLERIKQERIQGGLDDLATAIKVDPGQKSVLLGRLRRLATGVRDRLPLSLKELLVADVLADTSDEFWKLIPAEAEAFSVVRNMQSFSDKVDDVSRLIKTNPPGLLELACEKSKIHDGLARDGSLGWVQLPVEPEAAFPSGMIFYVPTSNFLTMIQWLRSGQNNDLRVADANRYPVEMHSVSGLAASVESHGVFAFEEDEKQLTLALQRQRDVRNEVIPFDGWDQDLDAYFVLTHRGIQSGLRNFQIPFMNSMLELLVPLVGEAALQNEALTGLDPEEIPKWLHQLAVGLSVQPDRGIAIRSRISLSPEIDLADMFSENPGGRELALKDLLDAPFVLALGGPISATQSKWITALPEQLEPPQKELDIHISRVQAVLLAPKPGAKFRNGHSRNRRSKGPAAPAPKPVPKPVNPIESRLVLVVTVDNSQTALTELERLFKTRVEVVSIELGELDGVPVLRVGLMVQGRNQKLRIATPGRETLVFASGGDEQLTRALAPFRGNANLSGSPTVHAAVRLLPESISWLVALDLKNVIGEWLRGFGADGGEGFITGDALPVALGLSWQQSDLEVHLSLPRETLPFAASVVTFFYYGLIAANVGH